MPFMHSLLELHTLVHTLLPTPMLAFNSITSDTLSTLQHHVSWLDFIRDRVWSKIHYEEDMIPSFTALERHWKRCCWVQAVWRQADLNLISYPPVSGNGWTVSASGNVMIDWDSDENMSQVRSRVALIKKGCACKTGCTSSRCKCKKSGNYCGPGCKCISCCNAPGANPHDVENNSSDSEESITDDIQDEVNTIMRDVFGTDSEQSDAPDIGEI